MLAACTLPASASASARPRPAAPRGAPAPARPLRASQRHLHHRLRASLDERSFGASSAPAPSVDAAAPPAPAKKKNKDAKKAAKKAAKKPPSRPPLQKKRRRKAASGEKAPEVPPTAAELAAAARYDEMLDAGGKVYECFIRAKGPNQWFPLGPMAVKQDWMIVPEMWKAEADMKKAGFKMYPALLNAPCFGKVEYGYRVRDDAAKVTEDQIREANGNLNPFEDVKLLEPNADGSGRARRRASWTSSTSG